MIIEYRGKKYQLMESDGFNCPACVASDDNALCHVLGRSCGKYGYFILKRGPGRPRKEKP